MSRQIIGKIFGWDVSATEITCGSEVYWLGVFDHVCIPGRFESAALVWEHVEDCLNANRHPVKAGVKLLCVIQQRNGRRNRHLCGVGGILPDMNSDPFSITA
jgi:hypothetical protein